VEVTHSTWNFGPNRPRWSKNVHFQSFFSRRTSTLPSKRVQSTLIRSPPRAFQWAYDEHRTLRIRPQRGARKCETVVFRQKLYFTWRKSAKFLCVNQRWNWSRFPWPDLSVRPTGRPANFINVWPVHYRQILKHFHP